MPEVAAFLVPDGEYQKAGSGPPVAIANSPVLQLTLGVTGVVEQEALAVTLHSSVDGVAWSEKPIVTFPEKFYVGVSAAVLDLAKMPDTQYLQARWKMHRWGRGSLEPSFRFYLFAEG